MIGPDHLVEISGSDMLAWSREELELIPEKGFNELEISISKSIVEQLAKESIASPQLMQLICLNICILAESKDAKAIDEELIRRAFRFSTLNLDYNKVVTVIQKGKSSRGQKRAVYKTDGFGEMDLYGLILEPSRTRFLRGVRQGHISLMTAASAAVSAQRYVRRTISKILVL